MLIGVVADTHDDMPRVRRIVDTLNARGISTIIHCGDWVSPPIAKALKDFDVIGILGNNDGDLLALARILESGKGQLKGRFASLDIDRKRIAVIHGEYAEIPEALARSGMFDVVFCGHTHKRMKTRLGNTQLVNPGIDSVVLYDTLTDAVEFVSI